VAYEKGALFLTMLEQKAGREKFDAFLKKYFADHKFQSMTTEKFLAYLKTNLIEPNHLYVNIDEWVYQPGLPDSIPVFTTERFVKVDQEVNDFLKGKKAAAMDTKNWSTHEWLHFIKALPNSLPEAQMKDLDQTYKWTSSNNSEILDAWFKLAIYEGYSPKIMPAIRTFLVNVGRRKFLTPLYTALIEKGIVKEARSIFDEAKPNYHSISSNTIQGLIEKAEKI
ncbi:MAG: leukotriene A4 hydrolase C-terminal domain-containing protein, partial [Saprospiraceae bacterium]